MGEGQGVSVVPLSVHGAVYVFNEKGSTWCFHTQRSEHILTRMWELMLKKMLFL